MPTMRTIEVLAAGKCDWKGPKDGARIEKVRVIYSNENRVREELKFCYVKNGRHARTHLTIDQEEFVELFADAVKNNVFNPDVLKDLARILHAKD